MNKIILVADDNPVLREAMRKLFVFEDRLELRQLEDRTGPDLESKSR